MASSSTGTTADRSSRVVSSSSVAPTTSETPSTGVQINSSVSALREILTYPNLEASGPATRKNVKRKILNFVSGPESMQILLDEKLKKAKLAEKQKKLQEREKKKEERRKKLEEEKLGKSKTKKKELTEGKKTEKIQVVRKLESLRVGA